MVISDVCPAKNILGDQHLCFGFRRNPEQQAEANLFQVSQNMTSLVATRSDLAPGFLDPDFRRDDERRDWDFI
ncbi:MAG: hypothetical protein BZY87_10420 [SAR202 cluster bacterium Io17-Chloro-G6]|nr:MAG: hypothetical protein BZY87_10420 [SAR202 cluster bacterium Io17-Chloro-G6]